MSLEEQIRLEEEQLKKQLEEQEAEAGSTDEDADDAQDEDEKAKSEDEGDDADEDADADGDSEEEDKGDEEEDEKKSDNSLAAQLRIERKQRKETEKRLDALLAQQQQHPAPQQQQAKTEEQGKQEQADPNSVEERLNRFEREKEEKELFGAAVNEFNQYEREFSQANPDYENASRHVVGQMINSFRSLYPSATDAQAQQFIQNQILSIASQAVNRGVNPAEALYAMAYDRFGYTGQQEQKAAPKGQDAAKKLSTVSKNKRRSASPLQSGGQNGSANATIEEAANMNLADFSKLTESEIDQMINDLS